MSTRSFSFREIVSGLSRTSLDFLHSKHRNQRAEKICMASTSLPCLYFWEIMTLDNLRRKHERKLADSTADDSTCELKFSKVKAAVNVDRTAAR